MNYQLCMIQAYGRQYNDMKFGKVHDLTGFLDLKMVRCIHILSGKGGGNTIQKH